MKSAQLTGIRNIAIRDIPKPQLTSDHDVLLRIGAVGICGSDIHYYVDGRIGDQMLKYPVTPGHEFSATVVQTGDKVTSLAPGDRVAVEPALACGECDQCMGGRQNTCRNLLFTGAPGQAPGSTSEFLVMPEQNCIKIPDSMTFAQAALAEPLSIAIYTLGYLDHRSVQSAAILGAGPIGLSVLLEAKYRGVERLYVTDKLEERLQVARRAGACWAGNPDQSDIVADILAKEPLQLDTVIECCGDQQAIDQAVDLLKPGGLLLIVGIPAEEQISFNINKIRRKEITIQSVRRQNECLRPAVGRIASGAINVDFMITHRGGLQEVRDLYDLVADYRDGVIKAVIEFV